ncbi:MAG: NADH-quinone oxidoreductase subunit NuoN [Candidatus Nanopelagicales bacterium]|nr:NADH-quinone oxidoreductase subunit NuoN [Candidatus Nanopelagicales bacterium]
MSSIAAVIAEPIAFPEIAWLQVAPIAIVLAAGSIGVVFEAFLSRSSRRQVQLTLTFAALIAAFAMVVLAAGSFQLVVGGAVAIDGPALFLQGAILLIAVLVALLMAERRVDPSGDAFAARASAMPGTTDERELTARGYSQTEIWPLFLFSVGGMLLFTAANDLVTMFIALEIMSLPLYLLAGMARRRRLLSQEAGLKYFILGAFSSAFFLYGAALIYGYAGSVTLSAIATAVTAQPAMSGLFLGGMGLLCVGLFFKVSAVPFHSWAPDVYQGAPTPITAFMATGVKIAAFGAFLRLMYVAFAGAAWDWRPAFWAIAILTFFVGSVIALAQTDIKRLLAYSSITHAGFLLLGVIAVSPEGLTATMFYLVTYALATVGAFGLLTLARSPSGEASTLDQWRGMGRRSPWIAGALTLFLLSFAGIPLTAGFVGKFAVFAAAATAGAGWLVLCAVLASAIAAFFYLRVVVVMFFSAPPSEPAEIAVPSAYTRLAIGFGALATIVLGIFPQPILDLASRADLFVR